MFTSRLYQLGCIPKYVMGIKSSTLVNFGWFLEYIVWSPSMCGCQWGLCLYVNVYIIVCMYTYDTNQLYMWFWLSKIGHVLQGLSLRGYAIASILGLPPGPDLSLLTWWFPIPSPCDIKHLQETMGPVRIYASFGTIQCIYIYINKQYNGNQWECLIFDIEERPLDQ